MAIIGTKGDIWHEGVGKEEAKYETKQVGIIVYPRKEADQQ
jgi:hypothetical protein